MDNVHRLSFVRLIGFSLFWTWLFLVAVSPSPTFGQLLVPWAIPFEIPEVGFRIAFLLVALSLRHLLATRMGSLALAAICVVAGPLTTLTLCLSPSPTFILFASVLAALTDAAMFLMWLCYFGYSKIGQTAFLLVMSYALGSVLCLAAIALGHNAMVALSAAAPIASGIAFIAATRNDAAAQGESLFEPSDRPSNVSNIGMPKSLVFASIALALYAFVFAFFSARTASSEYAFSSGPVLQALCNIASAAIIISALLFSKKSSGLYGVYRSIPLIFALGFALFAVAPNAASSIAGACIMLAYLLFEALSLNDYCNVVKTNDSSLLKYMAIARLCASTGIFVGWVLNFGILHILGNKIEPEFLIAICLVVVVATSTLAFTDRALNDLRNIADNRIAQEYIEQRPDKQLLVKEFASEQNLSKRETEVLEYLIAGRTTQYIASKLFIAESTARTHVHKIYAKTDTHDRMNLLDSFEEFCNRRQQPYQN